MRRFAAAVFAGKRDKSTASTTSSSLDVPIRSPDRPPKKSWKVWFKSAQSHKVALPGPGPHDSSTDDTDELEDPGFTPTRLAALVASGLLPSASPGPSPFVLPSGPGFTFPRSVNPPNILPAPRTLRITVLKRRLHHRLLSQPHFKRLPGSPGPPLISPEPPPADLVDCIPKPSTVISSFSPGLTRWISRPCFEDRYSVYSPAPDGAAVRQPVSAASFAVADLEFSQAIEAMVELDHPILITTPPSPTPDVPPSPPRSYLIVNPSPLRNEHDPSSAPSLATAPKPLSQVASAVTGSDPLIAAADQLATSAGRLSAKRGVRFAEEDEKDNVVPLSYVLRQKQRHQEKAQFLKAEAERRVIEERRVVEQERLKLQQEWRRQDTERAMWESERIALEKERKAIEEQKKRLYSEQVAATRLRREAARAGGVPSLKSPTNDQVVNPFAIGPSFQPSERNKPPSVRRLSRPEESTAPLVLPRREASHPDLRTMNRINLASIPVAPSSHYGSSNSPDSSRPPSLGTPTTPSSLSTPPTPGYSPQHVSSPEDVRTAVAVAMQQTSKRNSSSAQGVHNISNGNLTGDRMASYPMWTVNNHSLHNLPHFPSVPMIPVPTLMPAMMPMGYVMMDMPLLPPTPPFMMQQYPRQNGSQGSSRSSKGNLSRESSRERVTRETRGGGRGESSYSGHGHSTSNRGHGSDYGRDHSQPPRSNSFPEQLHLYNPSSVATSSRSYLPLHQSTTLDPRRASLPVSTSHQRDRSKLLAGQQRPQPASYGHSHSYLRSQQYQESPWTGVPTATGRLPNGMSYPKPTPSSQSTIKGTFARKH